MRKKPWTSIQLPLDVKSEIDAMIGDTRRPIYSFVLEGMRIREQLKTRGVLDDFLKAMPVDKAP